jgi:hypothetical protein
MDTRGSLKMDHDKTEWLKPKDVAKRIGISLSEVYVLM